MGNLHALVGGIRGAEQAPLDFIQVMVGRILNVVFIDYGAEALLVYV